MTENEVRRNNLKNLRKSLGCTQEKFIEKVKPPFTLATLQKIEQGKRELTLDNAIYLADECKVSLDWLYCRTDTLDTDSMVNVIYALRHVLSIKVEIGSDNKERPILAIDKRFSNFLDDFKNHEFYARYSDAVDLTMYNMGRKKIFDKHKDFFKELLDEESTANSGFISAYGIKLYQGFTEQDTIENYLIPDLPSNE